MDDLFGKSKYLGSGLPVLGSKVQDFMVIAEDLDLPIILRRGKVSSLGPDCASKAAGIRHPARRGDERESYGARRRQWRLG